MRGMVCCSVAVVFAFGVALAEEPVALTAEGAELVKIAGDLGFGEGPAVSPEGVLHFTDVANERIMKMTPGGEAVLAYEHTGRANGLYFDKAGNLFACEGGNRRITKRSPDGELTVVAERCEGKRFNQPNDLWLDSKGGVYFTDPVYARVPDREMEGEDLYYIKPGYKEVVRADGSLVNPNGIIGTAGGKRLYVADHKDKKTFVYDINDDGTLANKQTLLERGSDGMTLDELGNLYVTGREGVEAYTPAGKKLAAIPVPESTTNVTFGGEEGKTLFITCPRSVYSIEMRVKGQCSQALVNAPSTQDAGKAQ